MNSNYDEWDQIYREYPLNSLGWELGRPRPILVDFVEKGLIKKGKALDLCCGAGTNTVYLAKRGFEVTAIDISPRAIEYTEKKAQQANVKIKLMVQNFVNLPFGDEEFDFVFDMGCFHHVEVEDRTKFIQGAHRVLKRGGNYLLTCFSYKNGPAWNHFTKKQIISLFSEYFEINEIRHISSIEGDGVRRYFYTVLMKKEKRTSATCLAERESRRTELIQHACIALRFPCNAYSSAVKNQQIRDSHPLIPRDNIH